MTKYNVNVNILSKNRVQIDSYRFIEYTSTIDKL